MGDHLNEYLIGGASFIVLLSLFASKAFGRFAIPSLAVFLGVGMLAGSEGLGGVFFDNAWVAQFVGVIALAIIIFSGGFHTEWKEVRPRLVPGALLSTLGVVLTAGMVGIFSSWLLRLPLATGLLLGAIVSSTDAAAVFSVLRSQNMPLRIDMRALLEFESASNDPMAVLLTVGVIHYIADGASAHFRVAPLMLQQVGVGLAVGYAMARASIVLIERVKLDFRGMYPVLLLALVCIDYALTDVLGGSAFLATYVTGVAMGCRRFLHKAALQDFFDGLTWLSQITMFVVMGLLVFPSQLVSVWWPALLIAAFIMFVARPASVLLMLLPFRMGWREKLFVSWVGLRGSVPIVLATLPILAGVAHADLIFDVVFFIVLVSVLVQGTSIPFLARGLGLNVENADASRDAAMLHEGGNA